MSRLDFRFVETTSTNAKKWDDSPGGAYDVVETGRWTRVLDRWYDQDESFGITLKNKTFVFYVRDAYYNNSDEEVSYCIESRPTGQGQWTYFSYANVEFKSDYDL